MSSLYENYTTSPDAWDNVDEDTFMSQSFVAESNHTIDYVQLYIKRTAAGSANIVVRIYTADGSHKPTGSALASVTVSQAQDAVGAWVTFTLSSAIQLSESTEYCIVLEGSTGSTDASWNNQTTGAYATGYTNYSNNAGSSWSANTNDYMFKVYGGPNTPADKTHTTYLVEAGNNKVYYATSSSDVTELSDADGDIDCSSLLTMAPAYQKVFIANGTNLKVVDFGNVKIATADVGSHAPDRGNILTGGTSNAEMVVDYITSTSSACTIYGYRTTTATFSSGETVTGTDDDNNSISFTTSAAETTGPHWYTWTVYGADTTNNGTLLDKSYLTCRYFGRVILVDSQSGFSWKASRVENPFDFLYDVDDPLSGYPAGSGDAGEVGDVIKCLIPYGDDFLIFGCANSIYILFGDPGSAGQINEVTEETGIYGPFAWCKDNNGNLYFMGTNGLYKMSAGQSKPENISTLVLPNLISDWALDPDADRVVLTYDPERHGILISKTTLADGTNENYWYSLKTNGFYPESYPTECGIFCSTYFDSTTSGDKGVVYGTYDGYFREFLDTAKDDDAGASGDTAISSYVTMPITPMGSDKDHEGILRWIVTELGGGAASGDFSDSDGASWEVHVANDSETCLEDIRDGATAFASGTVSTTGRGNKTRPRARGAWLGVKVYNSTAAETWVLNTIYGDIESKGKIK